MTLKIVAVEAGAFSGEIFEIFFSKFFVASSSHELLFVVISEEQQKGEEGDKNSGKAENKT